MALEVPIYNYRLFLEGRGNVLGGKNKTQYTVKYKLNWRPLTSFSFHVERCIFSFHDPFGFQVRLLNWQAANSARVDLSTDTSFWKFWPPILTKWQSWTQKTKYKFGKKSTANFAMHPVLFVDSICLFPRKLASHNSLRTKDDKEGKKTGKKKVKGKWWESEKERSK